MLNRETGKYEPLFTVHTEKKQEGPVIIEHVSVVVPAEINDFLMSNDITTLDLGNSEHVKRLAIYYDFYTGDYDHSERRTFGQGTRPCKSRTAGRV